MFECERGYEKVNETREGIYCTAEKGARKVCCFETTTSFLETVYTFLINSILLFLIWRVSAKSDLDTLFEHMQRTLNFASKVIRFNRV